METVSAGLVCEAMEQQIQALDSLAELERLVKSGVWRGKPEVVEALIFRYYALRQPGEPPFGTPDLWAEFNAYFDPENYYYEPKHGDVDDMGE